MKKIVNIIVISLVLFFTIFSLNSNAASLNSIDITTDKQTIHPGETVKVHVDFGEDLGSYTVDIAYDNNLFEFVSAEGGTENDNGTRVRVYYFDQTGGSSPRRDMSVTFKAKADITTSNPTDFSITAEGLANSDASVSYDDIRIPIVKNVVVEPAYVDYSIKLSHTGDIIKNEEKDMTLVISSSMGKNYSHARIIAEAVTPNGATAKLLGTDTAGLEHDIIQSGWGDASGEAIGGKDVVKELNLRGVFSEAGNYSITIKLIDRDNSDAVIASETFALTVKEQAVITPPEENEEQPPVNNNTNVENNIQENIINNTVENTVKPTTLPKTGEMIYFIVVPVLVLLIVMYIKIKEKD